ncbi:MAG: gas vesicle protein GvpO [Deltaproteobacteria bacterium]|jgi:hypothetical protein|nr:gas vesicle protein GvpO [Deltaproteobacteria bacterium]MDP3017840.1 gas vesicle protein GvpO [Deltaproteobacteria bacterium]
MANIEEARKLSSEFLKNTLNVKDAKVIKIGKVGDGWQAEVEVYEESSFIKSLGLPTRMQDRNIYGVKLNDNLEVQSYERKSQQQQKEE